MSAHTYYVEFIQVDPDDSESPGCSHYAGDRSGFTNLLCAMRAGIEMLGKPAGELGEDFWPCCDWQSPDTIVTSYIVYREYDGGVRPEDWNIQGHLKSDLVPA